MSSLKAGDNALKIPLHYPRGTGPLTDGTKNETCPLSRFVPSFRRLGTPLFLEGLRMYRLIQGHLGPYLDRDGVADCIERHRTMASEDYSGQPCR